MRHCKQSGGLKRFVRVLLAYSRNSTRSWRETTNRNAFIKRFQRILQTSDTIINFPASKNTQKQRIVWKTTIKIQAIYVGLLCATKGEDLTLSIPYNNPFGHHKPYQHPTRLRGTQSKSHNLCRTVLSSGLNLVNQPIIGNSPPMATGTSKTPT